MRLQPKSLISALPGVRGNSNSKEAAGGVQETEQGLGPNLQSLAAELHQAALSGEFEYPRTWLLVVKVVASLLLVGSFAQFVLAVSPVLRQPGVGLSSLLTLSALGSLLGVVLASAASALLFNLTSQLQITPQGLGVSELFGWRRISWKDIGVLRVMEVRGGRYVVMVPFKQGAKLGGPSAALGIIPWLAGASRWGERGLVITSDIKHFERLLQLIVSYLAQAAGQTTPAIEALVDEDVVIPVAQLVFDPEAALARLSRSKQAESDFYGVSVADDEPAVNWRKVFGRQALIALWPVLLLAVDLLRRNDERPIIAIHAAWAIGLMVLGVLELPFVARVVQGVGDLMVGSGRFRTATLAYVELQVPRALLIFLGAVTIGVGLPPAIAWALWSVGIVATTALITRYVQKLYYLPITPALIASVCAFVFQASLLALYFTVR